MAKSYLSTPSVERLPVILEELHTGSLRIPPFQRDFEWKGEQRLALCSSIRLGLPTGSLMVWRTTHRLAEENPIGPYSPALTQAATQYLLDGRQRMTTLYATLAASFWTREGKESPSPPLGGERAPDGTPWAILYHLDQQEFVFEASRDEEAASSNLALFPEEANDACALLPLAVLFDDAAYDDWRAKASLSREQINRARALRSAFVDYLIPVVPLATDDIGVVTLTFKRVNSGGTKMDDADMTRALAWSEGFDLRERLEEVREELKPAGWGELDDDAILKVVAAVSLQDPTDFDAEELAKKIKDNPAFIRIARERMMTAVSLFGDRLGIRGPGTLPYTQILVFAARAIERAGGSLTLEQENKLIAWVAEVCLDERFRGAPPHMIRADFRALAHKLELPIDDPPRPRDEKRATAKECWVFSMAWARSRGTALVLAEQQPASAEGRPFDAFALIAQGSENVGMLLAATAEGLPMEVRHLLRSKRYATALHAPANRVVCPARELPALRAALFRSDCPDTILRSHLFDPEIHSALCQHELDTFFELRREAIIAAERRWVQERGGAVEIHKEGRTYAQG